MKVKEEEEDARELKLGEVFGKAQTLTNAEVLLILDAHIGAKRQDEPDFTPTPQMEKVRGYVERFKGVRGQVTATTVKTTLMNAGLKDFEVATLANLMPENVEEAVHLLPTLKDNHPDLSEEDLQQILDDVKKLKQDSV